MKNNKLLFRFILPLLAFSVAGWMSISMLARTQEELLWGWRPFFLMTSIWLGVLSLCQGFSLPKPKSAQYLLMSIAAGILLSLGFPVSPLTPLMFVGFVPLLLIESELRNRDGKAKGWVMFRHAFNAFFIWNVCTTWWVMNTSFLPGIFANACNAAFMAIVFTVFHHACSWFPRKTHFILLAALWMSFEYLHLRWELSWPWLTIGNAFAQYPSWIQWYEFTGVFGGSLWVLCANVWIAQWITGGKKLNRRFAGIVAWVVIPVLASVIMYYRQPAMEGDVDVVVVQPNFEPHYEKFTISQDDQLARFLTLSRQAVTDSTEYLIYPETSLGFINLGDMDNDFRINQLRQLCAEYPQLNIVTGLESYRIHPAGSDLNTIREVTDRDGNTTYIDIQNSAIQVSDVAPVQVYFKSRLVPGAEFFPFRNYLPFLKPLIDMLQGSIAGLTGQPTRGVFRSTSGNIAPVICYESVYGEYVGGYIRNGADMIAIITNDGWWDKTPGHIQHLKIGALRAIEHRRPIARSANTGISCFINARGDILQPTEYRETTTVSGKIAPGKRMTFYTKWGDMIARIAVFMTILILARMVTLRLMRTHPSVAKGFGRQ